MPRRLALPLVLLALALAMPAVAGAAAPGPGPDGEYDWPGMMKCGSFPTTSYRIYVYANERTRCLTARHVMKAFWEIGSRSLEQYPRWRCDSGSGGGGCRKGKRFAGYQN